MNLWNGVGIERTARAFLLLKIEVVTLVGCSLRLYDTLNITFMHCPNNALNGDGGCACVDLRSLNVWNGCRVGTERKERTFVLLRVCLN